MAGIKTLLFIILSIFVHQHYCSEKPKAKAKDDLSKYKFISKGIFKLFRNALSGQSESELEKILDKQLKTYSTVKNIYTVSQEILETTANLDEMTALTNSIGDLSTLFAQVDDAYDLFLSYKNSNKSANDSSLHNFLVASRDPYTGPINYLNIIYSKVVPNNLGVPKDTSIVYLLTKYMQDFKKMCSKSKSQQQILHMLFMSYGVAEMKIYSIMQFCFKKLSEIGECNFEDEMVLLNDRVYKKSKNAAEKFEHFMRISSRDVWRCDPENHIEDQTYTELKEVFQKYVVNDRDMNNARDCNPNCANINFATVTSCDDSDQVYDGTVGYEEKGICHQQRKCSGNLYDCEDHFSAHDELWICPSSLNSTRRYEFMEHGAYWRLFNSMKTEHIGPKGEPKSCGRHMSYDKRELGSGSFDDIWRHCEICLCTCRDYDSPKSEGQINVRAIVADNDYVVTGARLVKKDHILHVQIEQGKILADGSIDNKTLSWKPIAEPRNIYDLRSFHWNGGRTIYLAVTEVPKGHVLVGFKLADLTNGLDDNRMFSFKTLSKEYDYSTGKLKYHGSYYVEPKKLDLTDCEFDPLPDFRLNPVPSELEVKLENCDLPQNTELPSLPQLDSIKTVKFTTSDFQKDLGQSMIPFIDIQEVTVRPAVPLAGIGFYHKGREGYGGFLGLKLVTFDHSPYIN